MMHISKQSLLLGATMSALVMVFGCTGTTSMSSYARPGDTVMIAFGPISESPALRQEDLLAQITDSLGTTRTAKIRQIVNVYPDPASAVAAETGSVLGLTGIRSAVIDLVDSSGVALPLAQGAATLKLTRISDNFLVAGSMAVQILAGTGTPNPIAAQVVGNGFNGALTARRQVRFRIKPLTSADNPVLGSVDFELRFNPSVLSGLAETKWPQAVPTMQDANMQFTARYYAQGSDEVIKVLLVNPDGIVRLYPGTPVVAANFYRGMSSYDSLAFSVVWGDATLQTSYPTPTIDTSVIASATKILKAFDTAGNDVSSRFTVVTE